jgi:glycerate-2-kinase
MNSFREHARKILQRALHAVDPGTLIRAQVRQQGSRLVVADTILEFDKIGRILVLGAGKGVAPMAAALEALLDNHLTGGVVLVKKGHALSLQRIEVIEAGHPIPDADSRLGTMRLLAFKQPLQSNDLVIFLLTGGGSALLEIPADGISWEDLQTVNAELLSCGASIREVNTIRKHLSRVKGGQMLRFLAPAKVITLAISDVIGDAPDEIASGPTVPDPTTYCDVWRVIEKYRLQTRLPDGVIQHLRRGMEGKIPETLKPGDALFANTDFRVIGNNRLMLQAAREAALAMGYRALILTDRMSGEAGALGRRLAALMKAVGNRKEYLEKPWCFIAGGETTVILRGDGTGGRNQELALAAAMELSGMQDCLLMSIGSDGTDGPTEAAGAAVDGDTLRRAQEKKLEAADYLLRNDSYYFFKKLGELIVTGPTKTNVMDLVLLFIGKPHSDATIPEDSILKKNGIHP